MSRTGLAATIGALLAAWLLMTQIVGPAWAAHVAAKARAERVAHCEQLRTSTPIPAAPASTCMEIVR